MEKALIKQVYDFKDVTSVREGYTINAFEVTIKDGKVQSCRGEAKNADNCRRNKSLRFLAVSRAKRTACNRTCPHSNHKATGLNHRHKRKNYTDSTRSACTKLTYKKSVCRIVNGAYHHRNNSWNCVFYNERPNWPGKHKFNSVK